MSSMRGLSVFISDVRACRSREQETKRINKELANVRSKFKDGNLSGYDRKKYVCKLLYMYLLGTDVDFGHMEAVNLISSSKYSEKQIGYLAVTLLVNEQSDLARLVINSIRKDLEDLNEVNNCLALQAVANLGGKEMAESVANDVYKILISGTSKPFAKKKAGLCLLRLFRKHPDIVPVQDWAERIASTINDEDVGVVTSNVSLITAMAQQYPDLFVSCVPKLVQKLYKVVVERDIPSDSFYYGVPAPWLQIKILRLLQYYDFPNDAGLRSKLDKLLQTILGAALEVPKSLQQSNAANAVLFEAINLAIHVDSSSNIVVQATNLLGRFISSKETNMRYLGLETMTHLAMYPQCLEAIKKHQGTIVSLLQDKDVSVRRRALDLIYNMCDTSNARVLVDELVSCLPSADFGVREEMVLKTAILAEKFASEMSWYLDVNLQLINIAGDYVSDDVWYRVIQLVTNNANSQKYAAKQVYMYLKAPDCHETAVKVAGYILGEFGDLIVSGPNSVDGVDPIEMFRVLHSKFGTVSNTTRGLLLSTYVKFVNLFPEIKNEIVQVFRHHLNVLDINLQQRACEYLALISQPSEELLQTVCDQMPVYPQRESGLVLRLQKQMAETEDKRTWGAGVRKRAPAPEKPNALPGTTAMVQQPKQQPQQPAATVDLLELGSTTEGQRVVVADAKVLRAFVTNSGVLYEDECVQIGTKMEYHGPLGRVAMYFGNKTQTPLHNVSFEVQSVEGLSVKSGAIPSTIGGAAQVQSMLEVECEEAFVGYPSGRMRYVMNGVEREIQLSVLPVTMTKFGERISISGTDFLARWKQLGGGGKEGQGVFQLRANHSVATVRNVLEGLNIALVEGVDPNSNNIVGASMVQTKRWSKVGILVRAETNTDHQMLRVTVRATNERVPGSLLHVLQTLFGAQQ